ncbi:MAG: family 10 glycosylhydrolase [Anaerolineae bacterium]|nr:family 10 glycosylhydrolase [Anaerolineae bacterium]
MCEPVNWRKVVAGCPKSANRRVGESRPLIAPDRRSCDRLFRFLWIIGAVFFWGGALTVFMASPTTIKAESSPDFEALAGTIGRAEAWYQTQSYITLASLPSPALTASGTITLPTYTFYLPAVARNDGPPLVERRAIWITRYDWTSLTHAPAPEAIDGVVANVAGAGFNTIFFQVRAAGDAFYTPGLEPWSARLTSGPVSMTLGVDPGWDPLARMLAQARAVGIEVHAYINVYPAWLSPPNAAYGQLWPPATTPPQMFDRFTYGSAHPEHPGEYGMGWSWRQYDSTLTPMPLSWGQYLWASPGVDQVQAHIMNVARDLLARYEIDGLHLDLVRYPGRACSYDPFTEAAVGTLVGELRAQWQRERITTLVRHIHDEAQAMCSGETLCIPPVVSAAVCPYYKNTLGLNTSSGYADYYQDSKGWLATGAIDAVAPMLYGNGSSIPDDFDAWCLLAQDFLTDSAGRDVYPGIGAYYPDFEAIAQRIAWARQAGAPGHAIFSYAALDAQDYWDDLASGPYAIPALLH